MKYESGRENFFILATWSFKFSCETSRTMRELRGEVEKLSHNWQADRCSGGLTSASSLAWIPFISSDQWVRNKMDTGPGTRALFHLILLSPLTAGLGKEENELSYLSLLTRTDVGQAVSQPESSSNT